jgi:hypothetical protein
MSRMNSLIDHDSVDKNVLAPLLEKVLILFLFWLSVTMK